jgi:lipopolysaccharide/colanic/teichoic acid biosynthesis glycosyltransferase
VAEGYEGSGGKAVDPSRILDVLVASVVLVLGAPIIAVAAVLIRFQMGAPVLFRQERAGRGGRTFEMVKFRSMRNPRPGEDGPESDAARLTKLGKFIRSTSIDELPTMVNVLKGDMGIVGPRPLPVRYLPRYSDEHGRRHEVRPGITGWAQVNGRNGLTWDEQLDHDVWYVDHKTLQLDLQILKRTAGTVLKRDGVSQDGHATRTEFLGSGQSA